MSFRKHLAAVAASALVAAAGVVALAGPALAQDNGPEIEGEIFILRNAGGVAGNTAGDVVTGYTRTGGGSGSFVIGGETVPGVGTHPRPGLSVATTAAPPEGWASAQLRVQLPVAGQPESEWEEIFYQQQGGWTEDSLGFYFNNNNIDRFNKSQIFARTSGGATVELPLIIGFYDIDGYPLGNVRTTMTFSGTDDNNYSWSLPTPTWPATPTTTTVESSESTIEQGTSVDLTATVSPAAATGDVEFFAGSDPLGTATLDAGTAVLSTAALPVGTVQVTAVYAGDGAYASSTSAAIEIEVSAVAPRTTTTTLGVSPVDGSAYQDVTLTATVTSTVGAPNGTVTFKDGATPIASVPVVGGVVAPYVTNVLGAGEHELTAEFVGTAPYTGSVSDPVAVEYDLVGAEDPQTVTVDIPVGAISITTPYTPEAPLYLGVAVLDPSDSTYSASADFDGIVITDSRAGNLGFTASVVSGPFVNGASTFGGDHAGLTDLVATQVPGNALLAGDVVLTDHAPYVDGLATPKVFATYATGQSIGTAQIDGVFGIDQVPTSVQPGLYTATVTFTAV